MSEPVMNFGRRYVRPQRQSERSAGSSIARSHQQRTEVYYSASDEKVDLDDFRARSQLNIRLRAVSLLHLSDFRIVFCILPETLPNIRMMHTLRMCFMALRCFVS